MYLIKTSKLSPAEWDKVYQKTLKLSPRKDKSLVVKVLKMLKVKFATISFCRTLNYFISCKITETQVNLPESWI